jgi:kumamolisin
MSPSRDAVPVPGSERAPLAGARATGAAAADERVEVTVIVRPRAEAAPFSAHAWGEAPPAERTYMTRGELADAQGAEAADVEAVARFAKEHGLTVLETSAARRSVSLGGTVEQMSAAFGVELHRYEHEGGSYRGRTGAVHVPAELEQVVEAVLGLDDRPVASPRLVARDAGPGIAGPLAVDDASFTPLDLAGLYAFPQGANGAGECIALIELGGGYRDTDVTAYFASLGIPAPAVEAVSVDGAANAPEGDSKDADGEVALDIEVAGAIAPGARLAVYFAPNTDRGFLDAITTALHDETRTPSVISISWGSAESAWTAQSLKAFDDAFASAAALGVTVLCAAGDDGSSDRVGDDLAHADFPASSPHVIACGGTRLTAANGAISSEVVWNDPGHGAGGGGISDVFDVPAWQAGTGVPASANAGGRRGRGLPDLAADADPATGYRVLLAGTATVFGGTSAVAPLIGGLIACINQQQGHGSGFLNPLLYGGIGASDAFRDVTSGTNGAYTAAPGWDACTGWGSVVGERLQAALAAGS